MAGKEAPARQIVAFFSTYAPGEPEHMKGWQQLSCGHVVEGPARTVLPSGTTVGPRWRRCRQCAEGA